MVIAPNLKERIKTDLTSSLLTEKETVHTTMVQSLHLRTVAVVIQRKFLTLQRSMMVKTQLPLLLRV